MEPPSGSHRSREPAWDIPMLLAASKRGSALGCESQAQVARKPCISEEQHAAFEQVPLTQVDRSEHSRCEAEVHHGPA
jgi:hypothetical protein